MRRFTRSRAIVRVITEVNAVKGDAGAMTSDNHPRSLLAKLRLVLVASVSLILGSLLGLATGSEVDSSGPYANVCLSVRDDTASKEVVFTPQVAAGPGKSIVTHAVASAPCILLVTALTQQDGQLAYGWRPQLADLHEEWEEVRLPEKNPVWRWEVNGEPFDFYVLILPTGAPAVQEIKNLVAAMENPAEAARVLKLQTNKLRELISRAAGDTDPAKHQATATVTEVHGVTRGSTEFQWRSCASKVHFDDRNSGLVVFRSSGG
jgi:hypothetical protein